MRPLDPRLLKYAKTFRGYLVSGGLITCGQTLTFIVFAWLVTHLIVSVRDGMSLFELRVYIFFLVASVILRACFSFVNDIVAQKAGAQTIALLRTRTSEALVKLGPEWVEKENTVDLTVAAGRGLESLEMYFSKYLPHLLSSVITVPVLLGVVFLNDIISGIIIVLTLPIIPVFMGLIGWATQAVQEKQWQSLTVLSRSFLDTVSGLSTLKIFGKDRAQQEKIYETSQQYRYQTMKVLRISFLSGFVLELGSSLAVAFVALVIGLRLLDGSIALSAGLFVLLLAPDVFLPIRLVGASYHAATEGLEAAGQVCKILDAAQAHEVVQTPVVDSKNKKDASAVIVYENVSVHLGETKISKPVSASFPAGTFVVFSSPSGSGKSRFFAAMMGYNAYQGNIYVAQEIDSDKRRDNIAWAGQKPALMPGTVAQNVALGSSYDEERIRRALRFAVAEEIELETLIHADGTGLSGGQSQRVALARAFYRQDMLNCPVLLLDEPTSALDHAAEKKLLETLRDFSQRDITVIVASHRKALINAADERIEIQQSELDATSLPVRSELEA